MQIVETPNKRVKLTPVQLDVLKLFRRLGIRYMVVGGQAMRAHGIDRQTNDLDLWVARDHANATALTRFLRRVQNLPPLERLQQPNFKFTVGDPARPEVDILTSVAGDPAFNDAVTRCQRLMLDTRRVPVIGVADLINVKAASATKMESEAVDPALVDADRAQAARTAEKERRDIGLLQTLECTYENSPSH
ncbi:MAG: hypothetical protein QGD92_07640 [Gammaproteobacteria bacterium]|nr:hypothetical protein [Gammaproteobacteria bacterium]